MYIYSHSGGYRRTQMRVYWSLTLSVAASSCFAASISTSGKLADAVHAIANKCHTRAEYDVCSKYATEELASCSPGDLNCQRATVSSILAFCEDVCGDSDYTPFAVAQFLEDGGSLLIRRDVGGNSEATFVVGKKEFTASDVIDELALKQFIETRDRPIAPLQIVEERLRPAVSNIRGSLAQPLPEHRISAHKEPSMEIPEVAPPQHKRRINAGSGISSTLQIRLRDPQSGEYIELPDSPRYRPPQVYNGGRFKDNTLGYSRDPKEVEPSNEEISRVLRQPPWNYVQPPKADAHSPHENKEAQRNDQDRTVILYQDVPVTVTVQAVASTSTSQTESGDSNGKWGSRVKSILNLHAVGPDSSKSQQSNNSTGALTDPRASTHPNAKPKSTIIAQSNGAHETRPIEYFTLVAFLVILSL